MKVLVVGATGEFAGLVVPELRKRGATVRALIRSEDKAEAAWKRGANETAVGDLSDAASLRKAAEGVDGVFHLGPGFAPQEAQMGLAVVEAAKAAGARKFVFSGVIHPALSKLTNHQAKLPVEEALYESGLDFTVLQPTMFMQNLKAGWPHVLQTSRFSLPFSKNVLVSYVDYRDVAEAAALALTSDRLSYGTFELSAQGMVTRAQMAAMMTEATGKQIEAAEISFEQWAETAKIPSGPLRDGLSRMYADYDRYGFPGGNALVLRSILEREPRTLQQFFGELAQQTGV